jgi:hypothetical protein
MIAVVWTVKRLASHSDRKDAKGGFLRERSAYLFVIEKMELMDITIEVYQK